MSRTDTVPPGASRQPDPLPSSATAAHDTEVMIALEEVTKRYPGATRDAVAPLTMHITTGEFVVFLGPSGCGKTTTLRMINRLVEPTSGEIWIGGRNTREVDVDELRRHIGYVIQQVGLLPHLTIAQNIAIVPGLLGWSKARTAARVEELLHLVGLEPVDFARRYPRQLSGGQQQRIGVARALAVDPPVMLMDEPFGAIDPISRERLQDEFLALQQQIRKTIVFVTHDINEALKMGDRIAIFSADSRVAQFATPAEILARPANDYVRSFLGEGTAMRRLHFVTIGEIGPGLPDAGPRPGAVSMPASATAFQAAEALLEAGHERVRVEGAAPYELTLETIMRVAGGTRP